MEDKNGFARKIDAFFNGKGFYIVLLVCAAVIAVSSWSLLKKDAAGDAGGDSVNMTADAGVEKGLSALSESVGEIKVTLSGEMEQEEIPVMTVSVPETVKTPDDAPEEAPAEKEAPRGFVWPVSGNISLEYSADYPVYSKTMADWRTHCGIDIEAEQGERVLSAASGTVTEVYADALLGTTVVIDHGDGLEGIYCGLAEAPAVTAGDSVEMASVIGSVGNTAMLEASEPSHLHFEMTSGGESVNPADYLPER